MFFEKADIFRKFGTEQRILPSKFALLDLLIMDIYYTNGIFYVVDEGGRYIGTVTRGLLMEVPMDMLTRNPSLGELCAVCSGESVVCECDPSNDMDASIRPVFDMFVKNPGLREVPVTDKNKKLIAVIDRSKLVSLLRTPEVSPNNPVNERVFGKDYPKCETGLSPYAKNVHSQHGEDGIIEKLFSLIGMKNRYAVEFGGWDGVYLSNIRNFIVNHGYSGLFIEGDHEKAEECRKNYIGNDKVTCVEGYVGFINHKKLDDFLEEAHAPGEFDLLVIDIDGYDYHVWESLKKFSPRVVVIEHNATIPSDIMFITPYSEDVFMGSSAAAMVALGHRKGYELVAVTVTNCIFVKEEEYNKVGIIDNSLETLRSVNAMCDGKYWQAYDKTIYYKGFSGFVWANESFPSQTFKF